MNVQTLNKIINSYNEMQEKRAKDSYGIYGEYIAFENGKSISTFQFHKTLDGLELRIFGDFGHFALENPILQVNVYMKKLCIHFNGGKIDFWVDVNE